MATPNTINTPIALTCTNSGTATLPWFVQHTEYNPATATFKPLVNGEEAFGAVYDAIAGAKHSVDIICWGFQPSMYFKRNGTGLPIGDLLIQKDAQGCKVRLLCWQDDIHLAEWSENNMPGNNAATPVKSILPDWVYSHMSMLSRDYQISSEREFDTEWYRRANLNNVTLRTRSVSDVMVDAVHQALDRKDAFKNIEFATRDFSPANRVEIAWRTFWHGKDSQRDTHTAAQNSVSMGLAEPTHHQKMVLVDYEHPELATGFVMGHNMLDQYWDTDTHGYARMYPRLGRNGPFPWQDISSRVTGPVLQYLNKNFCQAWDDATGQGLEKSREGVAKQLPLCRSPSGDTAVMAQVLRTQSQKGRRDIETMYLQAVNNATKCIFIENQYFRWVPLAEKIKAAAAQQVKWGRDSGKHGPIHLFVITNSSDEAVGAGTVNTYRMLDALGQAKGIPTVATLEQQDARQADLKNQYAAAVDQQQQANEAIIGGYEAQGYGDTPAMQQQLADAKQKLSQAQAQRAKISGQMKEPPQPVMSRDYPGLKVHVCTLVAPDSPPDKWLPVYVHAKLMTVDDAFMTLGSANINTRSMEADSELNICHDHEDVTRPLRQRLWSLHTGGKGAQDDPGQAFQSWDDIINQNTNRQQSGSQPPYASLVGFLRTSEARSYSD